MKKVLFVILFLFTTNAFSQKIDTLNFYSSAFDQERTIFIKTPRSFKYMSDSVKLPVIYILDGQHEWFINPLLSTIEYLQFTKELPQALLIIIPHNDRRTESVFNSLDHDLPLHQFITNEIENQLEQVKEYNLLKHRTIIGHSFTASFALYSYLKDPDFYESVIANTPSLAPNKIGVIF
jgi:enterochelin esterase-like enzyme